MILHDGLHETFFRLRKELHERSAPRQEAEEAARQQQEATRDLFSREFALLLQAGETQIEMDVDQSYGCYAWIEGVTTGRRFAVEAWTPPPALRRWRAPDDHLMRIVELRPGQPVPRADTVVSGGEPVPSSSYGPGAAAVAAAQAALPSALPQAACVVCFAERGQPSAAAAGAGGGQQTTSLKTCSLCKGPRYCGEECQKAHWVAGHKQECSGRKKKKQGKQQAKK